MQQEATISSRQSGPTIQATNAKAKTPVNRIYPPNHPLAQQQQQQQQAKRQNYNSPINGNNRPEYLRTGSGDDIPHIAASADEDNIIRPVAKHLSPDFELNQAPQDNNDISNEFKSPYHTSPVIRKPTKRHSRLRPKQTGYSNDGSASKTTTTTTANSSTSSALQAFPNTTTILQQNGYRPSIPSPAIQSGAPQLYNNNNNNNNTNTNLNENSSRNDRYLGRWNAIQLPENPVNNVNGAATTNTSSDDNNAGIWGIASSMGSKMINGLDIVGEKLADALGITTPRYAQYYEEAQKYQKYVEEQHQRNIGYTYQPNRVGEMSTGGGGMCHRPQHIQPNYPYATAKSNTPPQSVKSSTISSIMSSAKTMAFTGRGSSSRRENDPTEIV